MPRDSQGIVKLPMPHELAGHSRPVSCQWHLTVTSQLTVPIGDCRGLLDSLSGGQYRTRTFCCFASHVKCLASAHQCLCASCCALLLATSTEVFCLRCTSKMRSAARLCGVKKIAFVLVSFPNNSQAFSLTTTVSTPCALRRNISVERAFPEIYAPAVVGPTQIALT